jgi:hypothetical protein
MGPSHSFADAAGLGTWELLLFCIIDMKCPLDQGALWRLVLLSGDPYAPSFDEVAIMERNAQWDGWRSSIYQK